jgi:hypothetical protein
MKYEARVHIRHHFIDQDQFPLMPHKVCSMAGVSIASTPKMGYRITKYLMFTALLLICRPVLSGAIIIGINLEFIEARFNDEGFDGGLGIHAGYEFKEWKNWHFGGLFEYMSGWYDEEDLEIAGEMMYESKSLYATARPHNWPVVFKAGIVNADYKVLEESMTQNFRDVSDTGYAYGVALALGNESFRLDVIDIKRVKVGNDSFNSYGISLGILFGAGSGFN